MRALVGLGMAMALFAMLPVAGTAFIWGPAAIFLTGWKPGELPHQLKAASQETQKLTSSK